MSGKNREMMLQAWPSVYRLGRDSERYGACYRGALLLRSPKGLADSYMQRDLKGRGK